MLMLSLEVLKTKVKPIATVILPLAGTLSKSQTPAVNDGRPGLSRRSMLRGKDIDPLRAKAFHGKLGHLWGFIGGGGAVGAGGVGRRASKVGGSCLTSPVSLIFIIIIITETVIMNFTLQFLAMCNTPC
ncbi:hypothetical protein HOY80DRAFT_1075719 [Tuber brumale]|nr:hypothetical protein HOY80DRAFT_1075719 [Tuber brumale]